MDGPVAPAVLIIRTWREAGSDDSFRAQIRVATDVSSGTSSTINVADRDRVLAIVRAFLHGDEPTNGRPQEGRP
jgi:hypothetical protein